MARLQQFVHGRDLLDVGAAYGFFLDEARAFGFRVAALEVSPNAADSLRTRFTEVYCGELSDFGLRDRFDVVTLFDTLEHIADLQGFLGAVYEALRQDGTLIVATPNNQSIFARAMGRFWWSYRIPEHVVFFNDSTLARALSPRFQIVHREWDAQYFTFPQLARRIERLAPQVGPGVRFLLNVFPVSSIAMLIPNGMTLYIAKKHGHARQSGEAHGAVSLPST